MKTKTKAIKTDKEEQKKNKNKINEIQLSVLWSSINASEF